MRFSKLLLAAVGAASFLTSAYAAPVEAAVVEKRALTAEEVVTNINIITTKSQNLQATANQINLLSGVLFVTGLGPLPALIIGFGDIVTTATADITAMQGMGPFTVLSSEQEILAALSRFVLVHQRLLNIIIGKAGLLVNLPLVGPPVASVLRSVEAVVDQIAFSLIDACPDVADSLTSQKDALDQTLSDAIEKYTPIL